jgi:hypothetical protein
MAKRRTGNQAENREAELQDSVDRLTEEVRVLRQSIDEFREDFVHMLRNLPSNLPPPYAHLGTLAESFALDVPETEEQMAPALRQEEPAAVPAAPPVSAPRRNSLFD